MSGHFRPMGPNRQPQPINRRPETNRRLDSWKEIASFLGCGERTVKRWETERRLPVHRTPGAGRGRVFAYAAELTRWLEVGGPDEALKVAPITSDQVAEEPAVESPAPAPAPCGSLPAARRRPSPWWLALPVLLICVALAVRMRNRNPEPSSAAHKPTGAEDLYLQGRFYWNKRTPESLRTAVDYFAQAIVRDPTYARAYVGLADCYNLLREFSAMPASEAYPKALEAARKAVQLDDSSAEAHNSLAFVSYYWNWDAGLADREFRRAIELNPNYVLAHHWRANFLITMNRAPEAFAEIETARRLDPASHVILADKGLLLLDVGRFTEAAALLKQVESQEPRFSSAHFYLAEIHLDTGNYSAYLAELRQGYTLTQDSQGLTEVTAGEAGLAAGGYRGMLQRMLAVEQQLYAKDQLPAYALARTHCRLGQKSEAMGYLRMSLERAEPAMVSLRVDRALQIVRDDPAFSVDRAPLRPRPPPLKPGSAWSTFRNSRPAHRMYSSRLP